MKTYALVGAGNRGTYMYAVPITRDYKEQARIVGVYDSNAKRAELIKARTGADFPVFGSFTAMLRDARPDTVIVTSTDWTHHEYIVEALEAGCDVISEKPLTIDEGKCRLILEAERRTGKRVTVTFNLRFMPFMNQLKDTVSEGRLGEVTHVHFEWFLDRSHGADYFRRWHRRKAFSGGLLVHKSTHHFDIVNWLLADEPEEVHAFGSTRFYGATREQRGTRCFGCAYAQTCEFYLDLNAGQYKQLYLDCEDEDGYYRDRCVFSDDIDIEDTLSVSVKYTRGALMSYSLTAYAPYEGFRIVLTGTEGRLEAEYFDGAIGPHAGNVIQQMRLYNLEGNRIDIPLAQESGEHGGGDERLLRALMGEGDRDSRQATSREGAMSCAIGFAANRSMSEGKTIFVADMNLLNER